MSLGMLADLLLCSLKILRLPLILAHPYISVWNTELIKSAGMLGG